jgi:tetratricopeptide (TPR) repeat protein
LNNRICVYAICKNEIKFVDQWLESMSEADDIVVLDTGSTDGTYEKLLKDPRVTRVEQEIITPWRFDAARNTSLSLATNANILVCTDLDERFEKGWADKLRKAWKSDTSRCLYTYVWNHKADGSNGYTFCYDKIHANHAYHWKCAVHEYLMRDDDINEDCSYDREHSVSVPEIVLHHYQDLSKPRASYLDLLKVRIEDNPQDAYGWWYLGREYGEHNYPIDEINCYLKAIEIFESNPTKADIFGMWMSSYKQVADWYLDNGDKGKAFEYYTKALNREALYREPYFKIAEICLSAGCYQLAIGYVKECLNKVPNRIGHWSEEESSWAEKPYDILSVAYYNLGDLKQAKLNVNKAYKLNPNDERIRKNYDIITTEISSKGETGK